MEVVGKGAEELFANEAGGHRWQRVPPTERRGRRHTSTVTVAVLPVKSVTGNRIPDTEIEWKATIGSGPGGQHRNKTASAIDMKHLPSGIAVHVENGRSQTQNRDLARQILEARVAKAAEFLEKSKENDHRRRQVGSGERGDKIRTVRTQDGVVTDHRTGKKMRLNQYLRGEIESLF